MGFLAGKKTTNFNWGNFLKLKFDHGYVVLYPVYILSKTPVSIITTVELIALKDIIMS